LTEVSIAGAQLRVCTECAKHNDNAHTEQKRTENVTEQERKRRAARNAAQMRDRASGDSRHWEEEGTSYDDDPLPYLVSGYGDRVETARQEAGLQRDELAAELDLTETELLAIEQGRATRSGVGGAAIEALEDRLGVTLAE